MLKRPTSIVSVQQAAESFGKGNMEPIEKYPAFKTPEGRERVEAFRRVLEGGGEAAVGMGRTGEDQGVVKE